MVPSRSSLASLGLGFATALSNPMLALYLLQRVALSTTGVSTVMFLAGVVGLVTTVVITQIADRGDTLRAWLLVALISVAASSVILSGTKTYLVALVGVVVIGAPGMAVVALFFGLLRRAGLADGARVRARAWFSAGWVAGPPLGAVIVQTGGFTPLLWATAIVAGAVAALVSSIRLRPMSDPVGPDHGQRTGLRSVPPTVWAMVIAFTGLQAVNSLSVTFLPILVGEVLHWQVGWSGLALGVCAVLEIPALLVVARLAGCGGREHLITLFGILLACGYCLILATMVHPWMLVGAQVLNALFVAALMGTGMTWFQSLMPRDHGFATGVYTNTSRLGGIVAAPLLSATGLGWGGRGPLLAALLLSVLSGVVVAVLSTRRSTRCAHRR